VLENFWTKQRLNPAVPGFSLLDRESFIVAIATTYGTM
jgi:hypothetical protein